MSLCMGCMTEKGEVEVCPNCGLNEAELVGSNSVFLRPKTELNNRYIVGIALGQGGFGITYIGYDKVLSTKVAIKEYYPSDIAGRTSAEGTVTAFTQNTDDYFKGKERFLEEARTLAKFADHPCIVGVKDCFDANGTAYMVMEFLEGVSLKEYLKRKGGKLSVSESISMLTPVMDALKAVHQAGVIHRDISPDNIFITTDARVRLIDFGAARQSVGGQKSLSIMLKPGYAPEEQYRTRGNQGPWTDVYALTATLYRMLTGSVPPDSLERVMDDTLEIPLDLPQNIQIALSHGLAVRAVDRYSTIEQLQDALFNADADIHTPENVTVTGRFTENNDYQYNSVPQNQQRQNYDTSNNTRGILIAAISVMSVVLVAVLIFVILMIAKPQTDEIAQSGGETVTTQQQTPPPPPVFTNVMASNITNASSSSRDYSPDLTIDGDTATAWNVPNGPGEWIQFTASAEQAVKGIKILNGYTKFSTGYNMWIYYANSRPKDIEISFSDGSKIIHTMQDVFDQSNYIYQTIDFGEYKKTSWVKIKINSIYPGSKWTDCCISEIQFF